MGEESLDELLLEGCTYIDQSKRGDVQERVPLGKALLFGHTCLSVCLYKTVIFYEVGEILNILTPEGQMTQNLRL